MPSDISSKQSVITAVLNPDYLYFDITIGFVLFVLGIAMTLKGKKSFIRSLGGALVVFGSVLGITSSLELNKISKQRWLDESQIKNTEAKAHQVWQIYSDEALASASANGKPVVLDFDAEWCAACKEMEQFVFTHEDFKEISEQFVLLRFDATAESPALDVLREKYDISSLPSIIFFNSKGKWIKELSLKHFEEAKPFVQRMRKVLDQRH